MKKKKNTKLISMIFYLAPGDYHRYHAPIDFVAKKRLLIEGYLKPVKISYIQKKPKVYENNERVCLFGEGPNGFLSMIYVGALNVGSINFTFDKNLKSNVKRSLKETNQLNIVRYDQQSE